MKLRHHSNQIAAAAVLLAGVMTAPAQVPYKEPAPVVRTAVANTVLVDPFPGDELLAPTLVSLKLEKANWKTAFDDLAQQAGFTYTYNTPKDWAPPPVTLALDRQPYMEALRQIAAQAGVHVHPASCPTSVRLIRGSGMQSTLGNLPATVWSVSGPFCFVLRSIEHTIDLPGHQDQLRLELTVDSEPKIHLLAWPSTVEQLEAVDDRGHSLVPVPVTQPWERGQPAAKPNRLPHWSDPTSYYLWVNLTYPKVDAGKRIAKLKALAPYWIQTRTEMLELEDPSTMQPFTKEIGGVQITVSPLARKGDSWQFQLSYHRATLPADQWPLRTFALSAIRPLVIADGGESKWTMENDFKSSGDDASRMYYYYVSDRGPVPQPKKLLVAVPLEARRVLVPIEFKDLPLP